MIGGLFELSTFVATAAITTIILKAVSVTKYWVWLSHCAYWGSILLISILFFIESTQISLFPDFYHTMNYVMTSSSLYFYIPIVIAICLVPDIAATSIQSQFWPQKWQVIREVTLGNLPVPAFMEGGASSFVDLQYDGDKDLSLEDSVAPAGNVQISGSDSHSSN